MSIKQLWKKRALNRMLKKIERADDFEVSRMISTIIRRYARVYPDQEVMFLSLPKNDPEERGRTLDAVRRYMDEGQ